MGIKGETIWWGIKSLYIVYESHPWYLFKSQVPHVLLYTPASIHPSESFLPALFLLVNFCSTTIYAKFFPRDFLRICFYLKIMSIYLQKLKTDICNERKSFVFCLPHFSFLIKIFVLIISFTLKEKEGKCKRW